MKKDITNILLIGTGLLPLLPTFGVLDMKSVHFFYLSILQLLTIILCYKIYPTTKTKNLVLTLFLMFVVFSGLSIPFSKFKMVSLVEWSRYLTIFLSFVNLYVLYVLNQLNTKLFQHILLFLLSLESIIIFSNFLQIYFTGEILSRSDMFEGFSFNLNVTAFSILIKVPFLLYFIFISEKKIFKITLALILGITFFNLFVISSRGAIYSIFLLIFTLLIFVFFFKKDLNFKKYKNLFFTSLLLVSVSFFLQNSLYSNDNQFKVSNRIVSLNDDSTNARIDFYKDAITHILRNPIFGTGVGTWKLYSIDYHRSKMNDYQVPKNAHNDFLHIGAELGIIGILLYASIFFITIFSLVKNLLNKSVDPNKKYLLSFMLISVLIYMVDANLNFPRIRGISQMNFLFIFSFITFFVPVEKGFVFDFKLFKVFLMIIITPLIFFNYQLLLNSKDQVIPYYEYNVLNEFKAPLDDIMKINDFYNPINTVTVPIKNTKVNYLIKNNQLEKAIELAREGRKENPFLYMAESQLSEIYLKQNQIDSALYYSKIAFDSLPLNIRHATQYQISLFKSNIDLDEFDRVYKVFARANRKEILVCENYLKAILNVRDYRNFTDKDKEIAIEFENLFPNSSSIKSLSNVIKYGIDEIGLSNNFAETAKKYFENQDFLKATEIWEKAIEILPKEEAFYLNIAQAYLSLNKNEEALKYLKIIEDEGIIGNSGKFEFLMALYHLSQNKSFLSCNLLKTSLRLGYTKSAEIIKLLNCL